MHPRIVSHFGHFEYFEELEFSITQMLTAQFIRERIERRKLTSKPFRRGEMYRRKFIEWLRNISRQAESCKRTLEHETICLQSFFYQRFLHTKEGNVLINKETYFSRKNAYTF